MFIVVLSFPEGLPSVAGTGDQQFILGPGRPEDSRTRSTSSFDVGWKGVRMVNEIVNSLVNYGKL